MPDQVFQFMSVNPEGGVTKLLLDCLSRHLNPTAPNSILVAGLDVVSERRSDIERTLRKNHRFTQEQLQELLCNGLVRNGWFFAGAENLPCSNGGKFNVAECLKSSEFVVDVLEGRFLCIRTVKAEMAQAIRSCDGFNEIEPVDLAKLQLMY